MLLDRIELSTSPLPRECSTTELRQQRRFFPPFGAAPFGVGGCLPQGLGLGKYEKAFIVCGRPKGFPIFVFAAFADSRSIMSKTPPSITPETQAAQQARAERLAAQLRENLKRRKQQKRGRDDAADEALGPDATPPSP